MLQHRQHALEDRLLNPITWQTVERYLQLLAAPISLLTPALFARATWTCGHRAHLELFLGWDGARRGVANPYPLVASTREADEAIRDVGEELHFLRRLVAGLEACKSIHGVYHGAVEFNVQEAALNGVVLEGSVDSALYGIVGHWALVLDAEQLAYRSLATGGSIGHVGFCEELKDAREVEGIEEALLLPKYQGGGQKNGFTLGRLSLVFTSCRILGIAAGSCELAISQCLCSSGALSKGDVLVKVHRRRTVLRYSLQQKTENFLSRGKAHSLNVSSEQMHSESSASVLCVNTLI
jgi:hypothetical protein